MSSYSTLIVCISMICAVYPVCTESDNLDSEGIEKRRPGWGKRDMDMDGEPDDSFIDENKRMPGWGKRDYGDVLNELDKRRPGWGKRSDVDLADTLDILKRRPGWGKRDFHTGEPKYTKRRPGWGKRFDGEIDLLKRAPGWGKRDFVLQESDPVDRMLKRRPGWGKRSSYEMMDKRRPGWGKRAPGWGKRSAVVDTCDTLDDRIDYYVYLAVQVSTFVIVTYFVSSLINVFFSN